MSKEKERSKVLPLSSTPTVEIKPHPEEVLDLDDETIAIGRAKLSGLDFEDIYDQEDRVSNELMVRQQCQKIRELFRTAEELKASFSSPMRTAQTKKDLMIDGIDMEFVKEYCIRSDISFSSDVDALLAIAFSKDIRGEADV